MVITTPRWLMDDVTLLFAAPRRRRRGVTPHRQQLLLLLPPCFFEATWLSCSSTTLWYHRTVSGAQSGLPSQPLHRAVGSCTWTLSRSTATTPTASRRDVPHLGSSRWYYRTLSAGSLQVLRHARALHSPPLPPYGECASAWATLTLPPTASPYNALDDLTLRGNRTPPP